MLVRITAEATIEVDPSDILTNEYLDIEEYLPEGKNINQVNDAERAEAMIYFDEDKGTLPVDELDWRVVNVAVEEDVVDVVVVDITA